jgi:ABC-type polysaccharide/polyol phosphate export permease
MPRLSDNLGIPPASPPRHRADSVPYFQSHWYPLITLVRRDFQVRYARSLFGIGWSFLLPLLSLLLYTTVFATILKVRVGHEVSRSSFVLFLLSGNLPFTALAEGIMRGSACLTGNRTLLKKVIFPAVVLPMVGVLSATVAELIGLTLLLLYAAATGVHLTFWLLLLPLLIALRVVMTLGLAWLVSILTLFFSDLGHLLGLMITGWLFVTPIFYSAESIPPSLLPLFRLNPLFHLITAYRAVILQGSNPFPGVLPVVLFAAGAALTGLWFFHKTLDRAKDLI